MRRIKIITPASILEAQLILLTEQLQKPEQMLLLLTLVNKLVETVPCYHLRCDMTDDFFFGCISCEPIKKGWIDNSKTALEQCFGALFQGCMS